MSRKSTISINNTVGCNSHHLYIATLIDALPRDEGEFDRTQYLSDVLLSKYADPDPAMLLQRTQAALDKLSKTEARNIRTSLRLKTRESKISGVSTHCLLFTAKSLIHSWLGDFNVEELFERSSFSNGAGTAHTRKESTRIEKYDGRSDVSTMALPYLNALVGGSPVLANLLLKEQFENGIRPVVDTNVIFTVPKDEKTERLAAKEPEWNMFFQKGLGSMLRSRLRRNARIDLNDQSVNRNLARKGSLTGSLATLDLSSASDSVTLALVEELLPPTWVNHIKRLRSTHGLLPDGTRHEWSLCSTMGNGFTFELESLIFIALTRSVCYHFGCKGETSIYGDDIITPTSSAPMLIALLGYCGFITNTDKSFTTGFFRESCGGHYYRGRDVTPFYIKRPISTHQDLLRICNRFRQWATIEVGLGDPRYFPCWEKLVSLLPVTIRLAVSGGKDMDVTTSLAEPGVKTGRLHVKQRVKSLADHSGYVCSLNEGSIGGKAQKFIETSRVELRPNCDTGNNLRLFLQEV